jgi:prepilin-type N-terminal cleavage/methylation domain-containing protein
MLQSHKTIRLSDHRAGMTMVEMIVALAIFAVVTTVVMGFLTSSRSTYGQTSDRAHYQQAVRAVFSLMTREIRSAGCNPENAGFDGFVIADDLVLQCRMDLDGDGTTLGINPDEDVTYTYDPVLATLERTTSAGTQTVLRDVQQLMFSYFDGTGNPLLGTPLSADDRAEVRFVEIAVEGSLRSGETVALTTRVYVRNDGP